MDKNARHLWMETGGMSGGLRHQIEFSNQVAEFFDDEARESEVLRMRLAGGQIVWRPLTYRGTDYGQWTDIWRLGLLTPSMGGPQYAGRAIKFEKISDESGTIYEIRVVDLQSEEQREWKSRSARPESTGGPHGRSFGYW
jgi:hypothetical protein